MVAGPPGATVGDRGAPSDTRPGGDGSRCRTGAPGGPLARRPVVDVSWYRGNSGERIHDVGTKAPNPWGLSDVLGNAWEWCWDLYDPEVYGTYRVLRGGGWFDEHWSCRASMRRRSHPTLRIDDVGFRPARAL